MRGVRSKGRHTPPFRCAGASCNAGAVHQHRDSVMADPDRASEHELGMHPLDAALSRSSWNFATAVPV
jgi:hypothetical protein